MNEIIVRPLGAYLTAHPAGFGAFSLSFMVIRRHVLPPGMWHKCKHNQSVESAKKNQQTIYIYIFFFLCPGMLNGLRVLEEQLFKSSVWYLEPLENGKELPFAP